MLDIKGSISQGVNSYLSLAKKSSASSLSFNTSINLAFVDAENSSLSKHSLINSLSFVFNIKSLFKLELNSVSVFENNSLTSFAFNLISFISNISTNINTFSLCIPFSLKYSRFSTSNKFSFTFANTFCTSSPNSSSVIDVSPKYFSFANSFNIFISLGSKLFAFSKSLLPTKKSYSLSIHFLFICYLLNLILLKLYYKYIFFSIILKNFKISAN